jgi:hypothetical protein
LNSEPATLPPHRQESGESGEKLLEWFEDLKEQLQAVDSRIGFAPIRRLH